LFDARHGLDEDEFENTKSARRIGHESG
jgi:hypothetical protein